MSEAKGINGTVTFDGAKVAITRTGMLARMTFGKGEKHIPLTSITAVQLKPAGALTNGFIQFTLPGGAEKNAMKGHRTSSAAEDENSVMFDKKQQPAFEALRDEVEDAIDRRTQPVQQAPVAAGPSAMEQMTQLTQMHDAGMITDDEFAAKRQDILSRM